jgi:hypothetical protein
MKDRFTHESRLGCGKIPREMRREAFGFFSPVIYTMERQISKSGTVDVL